MYFGYFLGDRKLIHPMNNPPVKYQLGEYSLPETCSSEISSYKCPSSEVQISTYNASGVNNGPPSTINSFFSASYVEKPYQSTSAETQNSKVSSNADDDNPELTETEASDFTTAHDAEKTSSDVESCLEIPDSSEDASLTNRCTGAANSSPKTPIWRILLLCCSAK